jgi:hypothetical protein
MQVDARTEAITLGAVEAIRQLFPHSSKERQIALFCLVFPSMTENEIRYWIDWHGLIPYHKSCFWQGGDLSLPHQ